MTKTFGRHLIGAGHTIIVSNSRGPETLGDFVAALGPHASAGTKQEAAACDMAILATNWVSAPAALKDIDWRGRILIDATNAHMDPKPDISLAGVTRSRATLKGRTSSEMVAEMAPGARLVKSISNMPMAWIQDFSREKPRTVIFASGDDEEAKRMVIKLIDGLGFAAIDHFRLELYILACPRHQVLSMAPDRLGRVKKLKLKRSPNLIARFEKSHSF